MLVDEPDDEALFRWAIEGLRLRSSFPYQETFRDLFHGGLSTIEEAFKVNVNEDAIPRVGNEVVIEE